MERTSVLVVDASEVDIQCWEEETTWTRCVRLTAWLKYREVCALNIEECVMCGFFNLPIGVETNFTTQSVAKETLFPT